MGKVREKVEEAQNSCQIIEQAQDTILAEFDRIERELDIVTGVGAADDIYGVSRYQQNEGVASDKSREYFQVAELEAKMVSCNDLEADLRKQLALKGETEKKMLEKAEEIAYESSSSAYTAHTIQQVLENCVMTIDMMERDMITTETQLR